MSLAVTLEQRLHGEEQGHSVNEYSVNLTPQKPAAVSSITRDTTDCVNEFVTQEATSRISSLEP